MTTTDDLAAMGEPPATPIEDVMASFLDTALEMLASGEPVQTEKLLSGAPDLGAQGDRVFGQLKTLCRAASSVWEHSGLRILPDPFPGEFRVRRLLGRGSFGEVWLADDLNLGRPVALKTLRYPLLTSDEQDAVRAALRNEARLLAALRHPNIVQVYAWRQGRGEDYLILQYVSGGSLADRIKQGPLPWQLAARYVADAAEALQQVHARGIVHRDIKPANLLFDAETEEVLLTDFGVSARLSSAVTGNVVAGTPFFMAPEAFLGRSTPALDVYGLAATLFCLITGEVPFPAGTTGELLGKIEQGLPDPDPRCLGLPAPLEAIVREGLSPQPERRPGLAEFAGAMRGSLNQLLADTVASPIAARRTASSPVDLRLIVSRQASRGTEFVPVPTEPAAEQLLRDLRRVPKAPSQIELRTGERVRIEVMTDRAGFVTVFNVGPTGNLNLLYPPSAGAGECLPAGQPLHILDVELTPPTGRERLFALWSRTPLPLRLDELLSLAERGHLPGSSAYRATRDMVRMQESVNRLAPEDWHAVVLQLDHSSGS
jgi:serine/threonine protein kinase